LISDIYDYIVSLNRLEYHTFIYFTGTGHESKLVGFIEIKNNE